MDNVNKFEMVCKGLECCMDLNDKKCNDPCPYLLTMNCKERLIYDALSALRNLQRNRRWHETAKEKPELDDKYLTASIEVICSFEGDERKSYPLIFQKTTTRGKTEYHWMGMDGEVLHSEPKYWQYPPEPPKEA